MPTLTAPDGTQLVYDVCEGPSPRAAILLLHGWSDHAGRWTGAAERLRDAGYAVYLLDQRGHGRSGGRRGHLSRFSQLLGDLQAFRRAVRRRHTELPQILLGLSFGGLVVLRYLETQPGDPIAAAVVSCPWLALATAPPTWKLVLGRLLADVWSTLPIPAGIDAGLLSRDPAVNAAYESDPAAHGVMTPGAWREIQWAQRAVPADAHRIDVPLLFLLGGEDRIVDVHGARAFADSMNGRGQVRWYPEMFHELLHDPQREQVIADMLAFLAAQGLG
jgi:alpha-beta hydrolase superfamily lysophospholipase